MDTIFITGGAGFIGSNLIDKLLEQNNKIVTIDNFNNYYNPQIKENNILKVRENMKKLNIDKKNFKLYRGDIRNKDILRIICKENKIDLIIHLAAMAGVRTSIANPELYYEVNVNGTLNLLEVARINGINKFIFGSSSSIYGNNKKIPFNEEDIVNYPISPYAASKRAGELLCYTYHHLYDIDIACLRIFTVYGPRQRTDLAIHKFTKLILENKPIPFYGNGTAERDYTYIDDVVEGIIKTVIWIKKNRKKYEIFNLGSSRTVPLNKMVKTIENILHKKAILKQLPMQPGDVNRTYADISKAENVLGYNSKMEFKEGIKKFMEWNGMDEKG